MANTFRAYSSTFMYISLRFAWSSTAVVRIEALKPIDTPYVNLYF